MSFIQIPSKVLPVHSSLRSHRTFPLSVSTHTSTHLTPTDPELRRPLWGSLERPSSRLKGVIRYLFEPINRGLTTGRNEFLTGVPQLRTVKVQRDLNSNLLRGPRFLSKVGLFVDTPCDSLTDVWEGVPDFHTDLYSNPLYPVPLIPEDVWRISERTIRIKYKNE